MPRAISAIVPAALLFLPACTAAVPAVSAISAGAAAGETGYSFWQSGQLNYVDEGSFDEMVEAVRRTLDRLDLQIHDVQEEVDEGVVVKREWGIRAGKRHLVRLSIKPLTTVMTGVEIDSGMFGNRAAAELVAGRIKEELDALRAAKASAPDLSDDAPQPTE